MSEKADESDDDVKAKPESDDSEVIEAGDGADDDGKADDQGEAEIVLSGDEGSQPENRGIRRRINKLNAKVATAQEGQTAAAAELEVQKERNRLLQLALDQRDDEPETPDPNDFDDGAADPKYVEALQAHITKGVRADIEKSQAAQPAPQQALNLENKQREHYKRADALKVKDYEDTEDAAIAILGRDIAKQVMASTEKSERILYYLGKKPDTAREIKELLETDPIQGVLQIGRLEARLMVKPKASSEPAPDPDSELEGATSPQPSDYERKLDKLRDQATSGDRADMQALMDFKREHRDRARQG